MNEHYQDSLTGIDGATEAKVAESAAADIEATAGGRMNDHIQASRQVQVRRQAILRTVGLDKASLLRRGQRRTSRAPAVPAEGGQVPQAVPGEQGESSFNEAPKET